MQNHLKPKAIHIILTGGTFDKSYDPVKGALAFNESHLPAIVDRLQFQYPVFIDTKFLVDSLDMTEDQRLSIREACIKSEATRILIVHGTDTMVKTASSLAERISTDKTIVLCGAMIPYAVSDSDALFNFGYALAATQFSDPGVYVAMNASLFPYDKVKKNYDKGVFEGEYLY